MAAPLQKIWAPPQRGKMRQDDENDVYVKTIGSDRIHLRLFMPDFRTNLVEYNTGNRRLVLYFHGNPEDLHSFNLFLNWPSTNTDQNVLGVEYVGYGKRPEHAHASAHPAAATPTTRPPHPRQQDGRKTGVLSSENGPSTVTLQQRCHRTSASARSPSWPPMPRPRLQRSATDRPEKIQLPSAEQNFFSLHAVSSPGAGRCTRTYAPSPPCFVRLSSGLFRVTRGNICCSQRVTCWWYLPSGDPEARCVPGQKTANFSQILASVTTNAFNF